MKNSYGNKASNVPIKNSEVNKKEEFVIPFEAACSPEFVEGCIINEDED